MSNFAIYITWHINDPKYWNYFQVYGIMFPLKYLLELRRRSISLYSHLLYRGFKKHYRFEGRLLVDSLISSIHDQYNVSDTYRQNYMLYLQYILGADILIQKDIPVVNIQDKYLREKIIRKNLNLAENALRYGDKIGKDVMVVVHGWNLETYIKLAQHYKNLGVKYVGIGSLLDKIDPHKIYTIVYSLRKILGSKVYIHVFGISGYSLIGKIRKHINSVDSSTPIKAAINKELMIIEDNKLKRLKVFNYNILYELSEKCSEPIPTLSRMILHARKYSEFKKMLAVINAFVYTQYFRNVNPCHL